MPQGLPPQDSQPEPPGVTHRAGVLGDPIVHSLSPVLHRAAYGALGLTTWWYSAHRVDAAGLPAHVAALDESWRGLSLTMPLKEVAFDVAEHVSDVARATGAINTLVRTGNRWAADNTDVHGILAGLAAVGCRRVGHAAIVGSGATARSALAAAVALGAQQVTFVVRTEVRTATLAQAEAAGVPVRHVPIGRWPHDADALLSTVPTAALRDGAARLPPAVSGAVVLDAVYGDGPSPLLTEAARLGYAVVPGTQMLLHQAAAQVQAMTGLPAPIDAMQGALDAAVAARAGR